jgi:hypothetical protein
MPTNNNSKTPYQDAYKEGKASFSQALNEFIEQGGNISKIDGEYKLTMNGKVIKK